MSIRVIECAPYGRCLELTKGVKAFGDIIREQPCIIVDQCRNSKSSKVCAAHFKREYRKLSTEQQEFLSHFASNDDKTGSPISEFLRPEEDHFRRILHVNGHSYGAGTTNQTALFPLISLASHSCKCNSFYVSDATSGFSRLSACRDLEAGEIVTITYIGGAGIGLSLWPRWQRQDFLECHFGFTCRCLRCEGEPSVSPTTESSSLAREWEALETSFTDKERFLEFAHNLLEKCLVAKAADDCHFHVFRVWDLIREFHILHFVKSSLGDGHLLPALDALLKMYETVKASSIRIHDVSALSLIFLAGKNVAGVRPKSTAVATIEALWRKLGGLVRDTWGDTDTDYQSICETFHNPGGRPSLEIIITTLQQVSECEVCGIAAVKRCTRCRQTVYCSEACQRSHWLEHKRSCQRV